MLEENNKEILFQQDEDKREAIHWFCVMSQAPLHTYTWKQHTHTHTNKHRLKYTFSVEIIRESLFVFKPSLRFISKDLQVIKAELKHKSFL